MEQKKKTYLSLGSNTENRLKHLQAAVDEIDKNIGNVVHTSAVYKTPSWGFKGEDFFNICIEVNTMQAPEELLKSVLELEKKLGRKKKLGKKYQNRCIDIDIILYENEKITKKELTIPHPRSLERLFVLIPLSDIITEDIFPFTNLKVSECIKLCSDRSEIEKTNHLIAIS